AGGAESADDGIAVILDEDCGRPSGGVMAGARLLLDHDNIASTANGSGHTGAGNAGTNHQDVCENHRRRIPFSDCCGLPEAPEERRKVVPERIAQIATLLHDGSWHLD